jgi:hypothetical protein
MRSGASKSATASQEDVPGHGREAGQGFKRILCAFPFSRMEQTIQQISIDRLLASTSGAKFSDKQMFRLLSPLEVEIAESILSIFLGQSIMQVIRRRGVSKPSTNIGLAQTEGWWSCRIYRGLVCSVGLNQKPRFEQRYHEDNSMWTCAKW